MLIRPGYAKYAAGAHDDVLRQWHAASREAGPLCLDLTGIEFFDPYGLCELALFLNHLPPEARPVHLKFPGWPGNNRLLAPTVSYLTRMDFWPQVKDLLDVSEDELPVTNLPRRDRNVLLELTRLTTHDEISTALRKTGELLQSLGYTAPARGHILEVLSELCSNVLMHAQSPFGALAAMQTYRTRGDASARNESNARSDNGSSTNGATSTGRRYIVIGIGDAGIGVRASLAANSQLVSRMESDAQALSVAVQPGASRFSTGGHGGGLPRVLEIARRYGGRVTFRSGEGAFLYHGPEKADATPKVEGQKRVFEAPFLHGTALRISLPEAALRPEAE